MEGGSRIEQDTLRHEGGPREEAFRPIGLKSKAILALAHIALTLGIGAPSDEEIEKRDREERMNRPEIVDSPPEPPKDEPI